MASEIEKQYRRRRLEELTQHQDFGGTSGLAAAAGWANGNYVRQLIRGNRPITEKTIEKLESLRGSKFKGWFSSSPLSNPADGGATRNSNQGALRTEEPAPSAFGTPVPPEIRRLLDDLADLPPSKASRYMDLIHQEAEEARAAADHLNRRRTHALSAVKGGRASSRLVLSFGDGNPHQGMLPLSPSEDPFTANPTENEREFYARIERHPKSR